MAVTTLAGLREISYVYPDAPKFWLGDWANEGTRRFGVTVARAVDAGNAAARSISSDVYRASLELPVAVDADATSIRFPDQITREQWELLGGFFAHVHDEVKPSALARKAVFKIGDIYPADDVLSEWLATIAMAANDLIAVHVLITETEDDSLRWYFSRAAIGHFYEAAKHLDETEGVPEIKNFVASLPRPAREAYERLLALFRPNRAQISKLRNLVFHYPSMMNPQQHDVLRASRSLPPILRMAANHVSHARLGRLKEARFVFADELTIGLIVRSVGTPQNLEKLQKVVQEGVQEFMQFMNPALDEHVIRRQRAGAVVKFEHSADRQTSHSQ